MLLICEDVNYSKCLGKTMNIHGPTLSSSVFPPHTDRQNWIKHFQQSSRKSLRLVPGKCLCCTPKGIQKQITVSILGFLGLTSGAMSIIPTTHTGFLLDNLQDPLCRKQKVNETAEAVSSVLPLHHAEELPQNSGSSGSEGAVKGRQGALNTVIQRLSVLRKKVIVNMLC